MELLLESFSLKLKSNFSGKIIFLTRRLYCWISFLHMTINAASERWFLEIGTLDQNRTTESIKPYDRILMSPVSPALPWPAIGCLVLYFSTSYWVLVIHTYLVYLRNEIKHLIEELFEHRNTNSFKLSVRLFLFGKTKQGYQGTI